MFKHLLLNLIHCYDFSYVFLSSSFLIIKQQLYYFFNVAFYFKFVIYYVSLTKKTKYAYIFLQKPHS